MKRSSPFAPRYRLDFKLRALAALDANDGNLYQTATQLEMPRTTLREWDQQREAIRAKVEKLRQNQHLSLVERYEFVLQQMVDTMPDKLEESKLIDIVRTLSMIIKLINELKAQQDTGTSARDRLAELLERYAANYEEDQVRDE